MAEEKRPEWMSSISGIVDPQDYLLGRKIDKTFELSQIEKSERLKEARIELIAKDKLKLADDPVLDLERRKQALKLEIISNPLKLRRLREKLLREDERKKLGQNAGTSQKDERQLPIKQGTSRSLDRDRYRDRARHSRSLERKGDRYSRHKRERSPSTSSSSSSSDRSSSTSSTRSSSSNSSHSSGSCSSSSSSSSTSRSRSSSGSSRSSSSSSSSPCSYRRYHRRSRSHTRRPSRYRDNDEKLKRRQDEESKRDHRKQDDRSRSKDKPRDYKEVPRKSSQRRR